MPRGSHEAAARADPERKRGAAGLRARPDGPISKDCDGPNCRRFVEAEAREGPRVRAHNGRHPERQQRGGAGRAARLSVITRNIAGGSRPRKGARGRAVLMSAEARGMNGPNFCEFCVGYPDMGPEAARRAAAGPAPGGVAWPFPEPADAGKTASKSRAVTQGPSFCMSPLRGPRIHGSR